MVLLYLNIFSCPGYLGDIINTRVGGQGLEFNNDTTEYLTFWQRELTLECKTSIFFLQHYFCNFELANFIDKGCTGAPKGIKNVQLSGGMQGFTGTMSPYICSKGCHGKMGTSM